MVSAPSDEQDTIERTGTGGRAPAARWCATASWSATCSPSRSPSWSPVGSFPSAAASRSATQATCSSSSRCCRCGSRWPASTGSSAAIPSHLTTPASTKSGRSSMQSPWASGWQSPWPTLPPFPAQDRPAGGLLAARQPVRPDRGRSATRLMLRSQAARAARRRGRRRPRRSGDRPQDPPEPPLRAGAGRHHRRRPAAAAPRAGRRARAGRDRNWPGWSRSRASSTWCCSRPTTPPAWTSCASARAGVQVDIVPRLFEVVGPRRVRSLEGTPLLGLTPPVLGPRTAWSSARWTCWDRCSGCWCSPRCS